MIKSFFKSALRNIWKNRTFSLLNIVGLAIGLSCAMFIFLYAEDELNFNHNFSKRDHVYRIMENFHVDGKINTWGGSSALLAGAIQREIPGIAATARMNFGSKELFSIGDKNIGEEGNYADPSILSMLDLSFLKGNPADAFGKAHSLLISGSMAEKFFGSNDPIGKMITLNHEQPYVVSGVFRDLPANSSFRFDWLASFPDFEAKNPWIKQAWGVNAISTYVETAPGADIQQINKALHGFLLAKQSNEVYPFLYSMNDWHLHDVFVDGVQTGGRIQYVHLFLIIAWIILIIACINFMNLSTARSEKRAREIGVRKAIGASRGGLVFQFIGEAMILAFFSMVLTLFIVLLLLPSFNALSEKDLSGTVFTFPHIGFLFLTTFICGLIAGSYPALYLSSFNPITALKGLKLKTSFSAGFIRRGLVVFQFAASIMLIIGTMIVFQQIDHTRDRQLGYQKDNLLYIDLQANLSDHFDAMLHSMRATGLIENASLSSDQILDMSDQTTDFNWEGKDMNRKTLISMVFVSPQYLSSMGMQLADGRDFYPDAKKDSNSVIVSESMLKLMGDEGRLGHLITYNALKLRIVGVVKDFVYNKLYDTHSPPVVILCNPQETHFMNVRLDQHADPSKAIASLESIIKVNNPSHPFEYHFLDEQFDSLFKVERLTGKLAGIFASLSILISCIGLFGLAAYTTERRTKEMGIRKVLGASSFSVVSLLSKEFIRLVAVACVIAFPLSGWIMSMWLRDFEYRTSINWWVFLLAGVGALAITLVTVGFQAVKASLINPLKSLRSE